MVVFYNMVRPVIKKMMGARNYQNKIIKATLTKEIKRNKNRLSFTRAVVEYKDGKYLATPYEKQGSHMLTSMIYSNGLIIVEIGVEKIKEGEEVEVILI